ncbi:MAG: hypothetical protein COA60_005485 [Robiginitomaculum sp.]|nr:hypothetical protein [Robiginitomaculum sp.]
MHENKKFKEVKLPNWQLVFWMLNPLLALNEFIFGQRIPKITLIDQHSDEIFANRSFVQCPHCQTIHSAHRWGKGNAFWHFAGLYCPTCENKIPVLHNIFTIVLLALSFPIWKPLQVVFAERFKKWELSRLHKTKGIEKAPPQKISVIKIGLPFGLFMGLFYVLYGGIGNGYTLLNTIIGLLCGALAGVLVGLIMAFMANKKPRTSAS